MGKANEIIQWVLIGLLIVYAVALPIVLYKVGTEGLKMIVMGMVVQDIRSHPFDYEKYCQTKSDCTYGKFEKTFSVPEGMTSLFDYASDFERTVSVEDCFNKQRVNNLENVSSEGECACISGMCGWIK
jgi:hypothetical protein